MAFEALPDNQQVSDDFLLAYDPVSKLYGAVRAENEECPFRFTDKSLWLVISQAVFLFQQHLVMQATKRLIPSWDDNLKKVVWQ